MSENFVADVDIKEIAEAYALDAVDGSQRFNKIPLDFSEHSIEYVEFIMYQMHLAAKTEKPSHDQIHDMAKVFGSYVGEVFIRHHGGEWGWTILGGDKIPGIRAAKGDHVFWPWARAFARLAEGPENNMWHYYQHLTNTGDPE